MIGYFFQSVRLISDELSRAGRQSDERAMEAGFESRVPAKLR